MSPLQYNVNRQVCAKLLFLYCYTLYIMYVYRLQYSDILSPYKILAGHIVNIPHFVCVFFILK